MFELDDKWKNRLTILVIKEMIFAATLVRWTERFQPRTFLS